MTRIHITIKRIREAQARIAATLNPKAVTSEAIAKDVEAFLARGGTIQSIEPGASGKADLEALRRAAAKRGSRPYNPCREPGGFVKFR